ncbi:DNA-dependent RNA polymerase II, partial [Coemansia sp. RSA 2399]
MADGDSYYDDEVTYDGDAYGAEQEDDYETLSQEDCWAVITRYFDEHGLVRQQINSFNHFIEHTLQEIVYENRYLVIETIVPGNNDYDRHKRFHIEFGQVYIDLPSSIEADGQLDRLCPQEARLRNLTYSSPLFLQYGQKTLIADRGNPRNQNVTSVADMELEVEDDQGHFDRDGKLISKQRKYIGRIPIMLRSNYCTLKGLKDQELYDLGECP